MLHNMSSTLSFVVKPTKPIPGQKPGTSGLRKPTKTFQQENYTENFVQSLLIAAKADTPNRPLARLVLGGDGRYWVRETLRDCIVPMCAANGISEVIIGQYGLLSTPAASHLVRELKADGAILLTASHNPGGPDADFGIKYNTANGGPAPERVTDAIHIVSERLTEYRTLAPCCLPLAFDLDKIADTDFNLPDGSRFKVSVISSTRHYCDYMSRLFDFPSIRTLLTGSDNRPALKLIVSGMHGVMGPYIRTVLCEALGLPSNCALEAEPLLDFGGGHPDPNLTYAASLVALAKALPDQGMAAAFDGDGDRNMLLGGRGFFVCPCDSLAVIADNAECIPHLKREGVIGFARSMPTSRALDKVCESRGYKCYEVPTGWKFFGNLMDAGMCQVCGEESFGTGSMHVREKDGLWTLLAWLSLLATRRKACHPADTVEAVLRAHWATHGRHFFTRYDYEDCESEHGVAIMKRLSSLLEDSSVKGRRYELPMASYVIASVDNFAYLDPVDNSQSKNQGIRVFLESGTRLVFRLSGTGSKGATLRIYVDSYEQDVSKHEQSAGVYLKPAIELAIELSGVREITGRQEPTVIT